MERRRSRGVITKAALVIVLAAPPTLARAGPHVTAGIGSGLPYGSPFVGVGATLELGDHAALVGGIGPGYHAVFAFGGRLNFRAPSARWRPHLSLMAWPDCCDTADGGREWGKAVYAGVDHDIGDPGTWFLTYGLGFGNGVNQATTVGVLFGFGYRFGARDRH